MSNALSHQPEPASGRRVVLLCRNYPVLVVDGKVMAFRLKHGLALLMLLSEARSKSARTQLAETLWSDAPDSVGRTRLRRLAHEINSALGLALVVGDTDTLWFDDALVLVESDVINVRKAARQLLASTDDAESRLLLEILLSPASHAVADGLNIDSDMFNAWLDAQRHEQLSLVVRALGMGGQRLCDAGQADLAVDAAMRLISLDPLTDAGHAVLLQARGLLGDAAGVEAAYFSCAELMRIELGMRPSPRIEAAYAAAQVQLSTTTDDGRGHGAHNAQRLPPILFTDAQDGAVAYMELGSGDTTLIILFGLWSHVEVAWEEPGIRGILLRLAKLCRVVLMDRRGTGLSERVGVQQSLRSGAEDIEAVRKSVGADKVWLLGNSTGGTIAIEHAYRYPQHVNGLLLYGTGARSSWAEDYPWAPTEQQLDMWLEELRNSWGQATSWKQFAPSMTDDLAAQDWWARMLRQSLSRNSVVFVLESFARMDVRDRLPHLSVPTLIVQRRGDRIVREGAARYLADHIPESELLMLPGDDHLIWCGNIAATLDPMEKFMMRNRPVFGK
jgi:pimeloyl-ACP methyl ester carboxylesterase/DNA-binding SARP family transcriptional activator